MVGKGKVYRADRRAHRGISDRGACVCPKCERGTVYEGIACDVCGYYKASWQKGG